MFFNFPIFLTFLIVLKKSEVIFPYGHSFNGSFLTYTNFGYLHFLVNLDFRYCANILFLIFHTLYTYIIDNFNKMCLLNFISLIIDIDVQLVYINNFGCISIFFGSVAIQFCALWFRV